MDFELNVSRLNLVAKNRKALPLGPKIYYIVSPYREAELVKVLYKNVVGHNTTQIESGL